MANKNNETNSSEGGPDKESILYYLVDQYPQVPQETIAGIVRMHGSDLEMCCTLVQSYMYNQQAQMFTAENPLYGRTYTPPNAVATAYYPQNQRKNIGPPKAMTRSVPPWPANNDQHHTPANIQGRDRATADSGRYTMSPLAQPTPSPASSTAGSSPGSSLGPFNLIGRLRSSFGRKQKEKNSGTRRWDGFFPRNNSASGLSPEPAGPSQPEHRRSPVFLGKAGRGESSPALHNNQTVPDAPAPQRRKTIAGDPPPILRVYGPLEINTEFDRQTVDVSDLIFDSKNDGNVESPSTNRPRVTFGPRADIQKLSPEYAQYLQKQKTNQNRMDGVLGAQKLPIEDLRRDVDRLDKLLKDRNIKSGATVTDNALKSLEREVMALENQCCAMEHTLGRTSDPPSLGAAGGQSDITERCGWICPACTFRNHPELTHCEMCEMPQIKGTTNPGQALAACTGATSFTCYCCPGATQCTHRADMPGSRLEVANRNESAESDGSWVFVNT